MAEALREGAAPTDEVGQEVGTEAKVVGTVKGGQEVVVTVAVGEVTTEAMQVAAARPPDGSSRR